MMLLARFTAAAAVAIHITLADAATMCYGKSKNEAVNPGNIQLYVVNGCTDKSFEAPECASVCACQNVQGGYIKYCSNGQYCCAGTGANGGCDCSNSTGLFPLSGGNVITTLPSTDTTTSTISSGSSTSATSFSASITISSASSSATAAPAAPTTTAPSATDHTAVGVGVGVGVAVPLAIAGVILFFLIRRRKRSKANAETQPPPQHDLNPHAVAYHAEPKSGMPEGPPSPPAELSGARDPMQLDSKPKEQPGGPAELPAGL